MIARMSAPHTEPTAGYGRDATWHAIERLARLVLLDIVLTAATLIAAIVILIDVLGD